MSSDGSMTQFCAGARAWLVGPDSTHPPARGPSAALAVGASSRPPLWAPWTAEGLTAWAGGLLVRRAMGRGRTWEAGLEAGGGGRILPGAVRPRGLRSGRRGGGGGGWHGQREDERGAAMATPAARPKRPASAGAPSSPVSWSGSPGSAVSGSGSGSGSISASRSTGARKDRLQVPPWAPMSSCSGETAEPHALSDSLQSVPAPTRSDWSAYRAGTQGRRVSVRASRAVVSTSPPAATVASTAASTRIRLAKSVRFGESLDVMAQVGFEGLRSRSPEVKAGAADRTRQSWSRGRALRSPTRTAARPPRWRRRWWSQRVRCRRPGRWSSRVQS